MTAQHLRKAFPGWHIWHVGHRWWAHGPATASTATLHADSLGDLADRLREQQPEVTPC